MRDYYLCIDFKSFYASCECVLRGLDPFTTNLVVADASRGDGAICLATSPAIRKLGVPSRCRLYEIDKSIDFIIAKPRLQLYMELATKIYALYLRYIAKEDIYVYSIDESFFYVTPYLKLYNTTPHKLAETLINVVLEETGITSTCGIGTNMYLAKIALDIIAKKDETHIGYLDEETYLNRLSDHTPLTDFWMIGPGTAKRLASLNIYTLRGIRSCKEEKLYRLLGINAEYLIDHAHGVDLTTISDIKAYTPLKTGINNSQILFSDYNFNDALIVLLEMVDANVLTLVDQGLVTNHLSLTIGYSKDRHKTLHKSVKLKERTNSYAVISTYFKEIYEEFVVRDVPIRKIAISLGDLLPECYTSITLFSDLERLEKENKLQLTIANLKHKYGKNSVLRGISYYERSTARMRNKLVGGHNAK